jgi:hypothetical protein
MVTTTRRLQVRYLRNRPTTLAPKIAEPTVTEVLCSYVFSHGTTSRTLCVLATSAILFAAGACAPLTRREILQRQGILLLSRETPFHGANQFLSDEATSSATLTQFLVHHNSPDALRISPTSHSEEEEVELFYTSKREKYVAHCMLRLTRDSEKCNWLLRGPTPLTRPEYLELKRIGAPHLEHSMKQSSKYPPLILRGELFPHPEVSGRPLPSVLPVAPPSNTRAVSKGGKKKRLKTKKRVTHHTTLPSPTPTPTGPLTFDQESLLNAKEKSK